MPAIFDLLPFLLDGLWVTVQVTAGGAVVAAVAALGAGLGRLSKYRVIRAVSATYAEFFRGTSALVQLYWAFYALPLLVGLQIDALPAAIWVLGLNIGAYGSEVVRGAVLAVPKGQREAAVALSLTQRQCLWRIIIPQAVPAMLPPIGNLLIELLKSTALVSLVTLSDLTFRAKLLRDDTPDRVLEIFCLLLLVYFLLSMAITSLVRGLERYLGRRMDRVRSA